MTRLLLLCCAAVLALSACKNDGKLPGSSSDTDQNKASAQPSAEFMAFYEKFHADSLYQMQHIAWPLRGETTAPDESGADNRRLAVWTPDTWRMHRPLDMSTGEFKRSWEVLGDELVLERIRYAAANYGMERRFTKRDDGEWELVYYLDMQ